MTSPTTKNQVLRLLGSLFFLILLGAICGLVFRTRIETMGNWLITNLGLWGLVIGTIITDTSPLPLTSEPIAILGMGANLPLWKIICIMSLTSHMAGPLGYICGQTVSQYPLVQQLLNGRLAPIATLVQKHGTTAVAMGALLPIPYALTTWIAGATHIGLWKTFLASTLRWIKTFVYVYLLSLGWNL